MEYDNQKVGLMNLTVVNQDGSDIDDKHLDAMLDLVTEYAESLNIDVWASISTSSLD